MKYRIPAVCSVALARLPARATEVAYCKASHRVATVALPLSIGAGLKKIRERIGTRRLLVDLEVLGIRQSRDEPFMKATGSFHRESPGTRLRITTGEDGLEALVTGPWRPFPAQDKLASGLSLVADCGLIVRTDSGYASL
jgi:hypothetical protein